jgi:hypothetical protein
MVKINDTTVSSINTALRKIWYKLCCLAKRIEILEEGGGGGDLVEPIQGIIPISGTVSVDAGDTVISNPDWVGKQLLVMRDGFRIPPYNPGTGAMYYTKSLSSSSLTLSVATVEGEDLFIMVI